MLSKKLFLVFVVVVLAIVSSMYAITAHGFWLDELGTHRLATSQGGQWLARFLAEETSDLQMPLYHVYIYAWSQIFGLGEMALRMANLPFYVIALVLVAWQLRRDWLLASCATLCVGLHPVIWYYLNDARPYAMIYAASAIVMTSLWVLHSEAARGPDSANTKHVWIILCLGSVLLAGSHMVAVFWLLPLLATAIVFFWTRRSRDVWGRAQVVAFLSTAIVLASLAAFYLYSILKGIRATADFETSLGSLLFSSYEVTGLGGLGPGRLELREFGVAALQGFSAALIVLGLVIAFGVVYGLRAMARDSSIGQVVRVLALVGLPSLVVVIVGYFTHWRVLGRHLIPVAAAIALFLGYGITAMIRERGFWRKGVAIVILTIFISSALGYGLPKHRNEDYRIAGRLAHDYLESGNAVWWFASDYGANLYGAPLLVVHKSVEDCNGLDSPGLAIAAADLHPSCVDSLNEPDIIIVSRPTTYDRRGVIERKLAASGFTRVSAPDGFKAWQNIGAIGAVASREGS